MSTSSSPVIVPGSLAGPNVCAIGVFFRAVRDPISRGGSGIRKLVPSGAASSAPVSKPMKFNRRSYQKPSDTSTLVNTFTPDGALVSPADVVANLGRLSREVKEIDSQLVDKYMSKVYQLAKNNEISCRDYVNVIHCVSRFDRTLLMNVGVIPLLDELRMKLLHNRTFSRTLSPVDIALCMNALTRLKHVSEPFRVSSSILLTVLSDEIPSRIGLFDDHHLAMILHCLSAFYVRDTHLIEEIVAELEMARTVASNFTPQSVIMISSALCKLDVYSLPLKNKFAVDGLWLSIMHALTPTRQSDLQPNWPSVALSSVSKSGLPSSAVPADFLKRMSDLVISFAKSGKLDSARVKEAAHALGRLNAHRDIIAKLLALV